MSELIEVPDVNKLEDSLEFEGKLLKQRTTIKI
jgi:hypothetical protein